MARTAVILFNLGGPDSAAAVEPFLFNLFADPSIIALPNPLRWLIAKLISSRRAPVAREIYAKIGNASPLLPNTQVQAKVLDEVLGPDFKSFIAMRYWNPRADETARAVAAWNPDEIILLPLYPQYSSTTTGSSLKEWHRAAKAAGLTPRAQAVCCYPSETGFIDALAGNVQTALDQWPSDVGTPRILLSAHGLPKRTIERGDPYQAHVEETAAALRLKLGLSESDAVVCYQSRVGPLEWLGPSTDHEIKRAGSEKTGLIVVPIAFVSEHSETLVELDIEYRHLAANSGVPRYVRVPAVGTAPAFIEGLAGLVRAIRQRSERILPDGGKRRCAKILGFCPCEDML